MLWLLPAHSDGLDDGAWRVKIVFLNVHSTLYSYIHLNTRHLIIVTWQFYKRPTHQSFVTLRRSYMRLPGFFYIIIIILTRGRSPITSSPLPPPSFFQLISPPHHSSRPKKSPSLEILGTRPLISLPINSFLVFRRSFPSAGDAGWIPRCRRAAFAFGAHSLRWVYLSLLFHRCGPVPRFPPTPCLFGW